MRHHIRIGLVGDFDEAVPAHRAIPLALEMAGLECSVEVDFVWIPTETITGAEALAGFDGLWCVPASPYRSMDGALRAIRHARESALPFLGTCGGFQHAVIEYARNVLGWADAEHGETSPGAARSVIAPLACALVERTDGIILLPGTRIRAAYNVSEIGEGYRCRYGLNPEFQSALTSGPLRASARDATGEVRAVELDGHPFFLATLFQPERAALRGILPPLALALVKSAGS